ncbi:hypothetical protein ATI61_110310 [Archangium gephyra]|uniref:NAD glycohydrolase translocation F5/8 type C domain-containing protein n=1 Tax=Archangium gephyra TaxID=48 RepID=A0AAC8QEE9_9BACT|nr:hypothetical protein [Archangium gephyra]AKJ05944.1 Hypothetical protein AA314_07570 [Archangium gephyra]REG27303.1 hypothetical protein ATI61_110310 [Archangium gephyra]
MRPLLLTVLLPSLAAAGGFQRLHAEQASATSFLKSNWNKYEENYHPSYVLDDDVKTAWVEGAEGDGLGESLTIPVSDLKSARAIRLVLFNGYQKSKALLSANSAPRQLTVTVRGPGGQESAKTQLTLERKMGPQSFDLPVTGAVAEVVLTIDSVHPGSKYKDTCVSDVQVFVDSEVPYNAAVEKGKREALLQWKKERLEAAKYFARLPKTYPFASTRFEEKVDQKVLSKRYARVIDENKDGYADKGVPAKDFVPLMTQIKKGQLAGPLAEPDKALLQELDTLAAAPPQDGKWYSLTQQGRVLLPENVSFSPLMVPLFNLSEATLFEAKGRGSLKPRLSDEDGYQQGTVLSNLLVLEGSATDVKKVYFTQTRVIVERTTDTTTTHALALLEGGRLTRLVTLETSMDVVGDPVVSAGVTAVTYTEGKMSRLEKTELVDSNPEYDGVDPQSGILVRTTTSEAVTRS